MRKTSLQVIVFTCLLIVMTAVACRHDGLSREERSARKAAERYYEWLLKGHNDKFIGHIAYADSMSESYRSQMCDLMREHLDALEQQHGKITDVSAIGQNVTDSSAHVFLQLSFADSTSEEIGLPLVKVKRQWLMQ